jgi:PAS domain S-box-containing protein
MKDSTKSLEASELRYRRLFESAKDGILILAAETGEVMDANPFLIEMLGYSHAQFVGKKVWELGFFKDIVANEAKFKELQQTEYVRYDNMALEASSGRRHEVEFISNVYWEDNKKIIQCNIRDITEKKKSEAAMREQLEELQRWHDVTLGREGRVLELKEEVNALLVKAGQPPRYPISTE